MKLKIVFFITVILVTFACKRDPKPKDALSEKKFIEVLVDVHIAEGIYHTRTYIPDGAKLNSNDLYQDALKRNNVTNEQFIATTIYYSRHPREFDHIYDKVLSILKEKTRALSPDAEIPELIEPNQSNPT